MEQVVSVCIPVYNGEKYIAKAIKSVLEQTYDNFELLVVNNCSTDKTEKIVKEFTDKRLRYIKNKNNVGMVGNWNICLDNAEGEYIQFLCADDYLPNNCLEMKINAIKKIQGSIVFNSTYLVNKNEEIIMKRRPYHSNRHFGGKKIASMSFLKKNVFGEPSNVMFSKEASRKVGHFDTKLCYCADWDYWLKLCMHGEVHYIDEYLSYYRVSNESETSKLLKTKDKFKQDDIYLIQNCINNKDMNISKIDIRVHKFNIKMRMYAREVFHLFNNLKLGVRN